MAALGLVLLIVGLIMGISILWIIGLVLLVVGLFVNIAPGRYHRRIY